MSHIQIRERREALGSPHRRDYERSMDRKLAQGQMPKGLGALMAWYASAWSAEVPTELHAGDVWHDSVSGGEAQGGVKPVGGSLIGTPSYNGAFRAYIENSHSQTDDDGRFVRPLHRAMSEMARSRPVTERVLFHLAMTGFDFRSFGRRCGWLDEMWGDWLRGQLRFLWSLYREADERRMEAA